MATGDPVLVGLGPQPPSANAARLDYRVGGSTPGEVVEVWDFVAGEYLDLLGVVSGRYTGAAFFLVLPWMATTAATGNCKWDAGFRRLSSAVDLDAAHVYSFQTVTATTAATPGQITYTTIPFTQAQANSLSAGDVVRIRIRRDTLASLTRAGAAELIADLVTAVES